MAETKEATQQPKIVVVNNGNGNDKPHRRRKKWQGGQDPFEWFKGFIQGVILGFILRSVLYL